MNSLIGFNLMSAENVMPDYLFDLNLQLISDAVLTMCAVLALFVILSYLLFNPAREMLRKRKEKIQSDLENAANDKEESQRLKIEYDEKIKNIQKEADEIIGDARRIALQNEAKIIAEAKEEVSRIRARADVEIELEKKKAADEVKQEIIKIASLIAGKVVTASIDTSIQNGMIDETLKEIGESTWLS